MTIPNVAAPQRQPVSKMGVLAVVLLGCSLVAFSATGIHRFYKSLARAGSEDRVTSSDRPAAANAEPRRLDLASLAQKSPPAARAAGSGHGPENMATAGTAQAASHRIPALVPTADELSEPIGVRRTGSPAPTGAGPSSPLPEDAPVMLVSTKPKLGAPPSAAPRAPEGQATADGGGLDGSPADPMAAATRNLQDYQHRLQGLLDDLTRTSDLARGSSTSSAIPTSIGPSSAGGTPGGQLLGSSTLKATASMLGNRSLILPKGTAFSCALKSRVVTANSGMVGCMVQRHVYGDDGRVLLIERGSHLDGEYRVTSVRPGTVRIPVLWTRVRTPHGVVVDLESPATGQLGEAGIEGHVDNRWTERIGAAMLLSLIDDSVKLIASHQSEQSQGGTVVLSSTTSGTSRLAEKVLDSTINIPPLIYQNQGGIAGIYVARDLDFSKVYTLVPTTVGPVP